MTEVIEYRCRYCGLLWDTEYEADRCEQEDIEEHGEES